LPWQPKVPSSRPAAVQFFFFAWSKNRKACTFSSLQKKSGDSFRH
jgi:hypothetical protein